MADIMSPSEAVSSSGTVPPGRLIAGQRVSGTTVYNLQHEKLGTVEDVMIDKPTGRIAYAVLSFGGFMGIGDRHHPLPWQTMRYGTEVGGYVVDLDPAVLEGAPAYAPGDPAAWEDAAFGRSIDEYYKVTPVWAMIP